MINQVYSENKKVINIVLSLILTVVLFRMLIQGEIAKRIGIYDSVDVVVSSRDLPSQTILAPADLTLKPIPKEFVQPGAVVVKIPGSGYERLLGKKILAPIPANSQIPISELADPSMKDLEDVIPRGKVAYILRLGNLDVSGIINPGSRIDIVATLNVQHQVPGDTTRRIARTILHNILVLTVGREIYNGYPSNKKEGTESLLLTLAVTPSEAEQLQLAQSESQGEISVLLHRKGE